MSRIAAAVAGYMRNERRLKKRELDHYESLDLLDEAIDWAAYARNELGRRHPHQHRLKEVNLGRSRYKLLSVKEQIRACSTFDELLHLVEDISGEIKGLGDLYCYDTALRLGAYLGVFPAKVYLHAGTRDGAKVLGLNWKAESVDLESLPEELLCLGPYEIEDMLCIYKDFLGRK